MKRVLLVDNYDSFTYNLAHLLGELGADVVVRRNDAPGLERLQPERLVVSPGPGRPSERIVSLVGESRVTLTSALSWRLRLVTVACTPVPACAC